MTEPVIIDRDPHGGECADVSADQRSTPKVITLHRASVIETEHGQGLCVIKKLSTGGAMIHTAMTLAADDRLILAMVSGSRISGRVCWVGDGLTGVEFDSPTPLSTVLDRGSCGLQPRRMPQLNVDVR